MHLPNFTVMALSLPLAHAYTFRSYAASRRGCTDPYYHNRFDNQPRCYNLHRDEEYIGLLSDPADLRVELYEGTDCVGRPAHTYNQAACIHNTNERFKSVFIRIIY